MFGRARTLALPGQVFETVPGTHAAQPLHLAISPWAGKVCPESETVRIYEANLDRDDHSCSIGACPHNQCWGLRRRRLGLGLGHWRWRWLLRLRLGGISRFRWTRILRRLRVLRLCPGLCRPRLPCPGVCCSGLHHARCLHRTRVHHARLHHTGLYHSGLPAGSGSRNSLHCEDGPDKADLDCAGLCPRSRRNLCCPGLRQLSKPAGTGDFSRDLLRSHLVRLHAWKAV